LPILAVSPTPIAIVGLQFSLISQIYQRQGEDLGVLCLHQMEKVDIELKGLWAEVFEDREVDKRHLDLLF